MNRLYTAYGSALLAFLALSAFFGWSFTEVNETKDVPKSVRDNPGSYRSHYAAHPHSFGGK